MQVAILREIGDRLLSLQETFKEQTPEGIVEPLPPFTATSEPSIHKPIFGDKPWFSVVIVKEGSVQLHVVINTGKSSTTPYTMGVDEKVYDQYFSTPCIKDIMVWTNSGETCTVKVRGSR